MAKILLTWELGGGSGHTVNLRPFFCGLAAAGHKVFVALRDLSKGPNFVGGNAVSFLQSPYKSDFPPNVIQVRGPSRISCTTSVSAMPRNWP